MSRAARRGQSEASLERYCVKRAKARGWLSRKMNGLGFNDWPDRLFVRPSKGGTLWVEFKRPGKEATPSQAHLHTLLRRRGEDVRVIDTREDFLRLLDE